MGPATNAINNLALALISVFGAILYLHGSISIGSISAFVLYSRKFTGPIREIAEIYGELQSSLAAAERVFKVIDEPPEPADLESAAPLENAQGDVELSHVSFGYQKDQVILKDFSMKAPKGSLIAIVGPTGAGKTTFINLLMRFYDIDSGSILVDGRNISDITREKPPAFLLHGPPGHLALLRHHLRKYRLRAARRHQGRGDRRGKGGQDPHLHRKPSPGL